MPLYEDEHHPQSCVIDAPAGVVDSAQLVDYIAAATQRLETIEELWARGEAVDVDSRDWMLTQVDYIVETIGNDQQELGDEMRSNMLQLLLAIANLNEQIRHPAPPAL